MNYNKKTIEDDWCRGYNDGAVSLSTLNSSAIASGTQAAVDSAISKIKAGTLEVFDTSAFTVANAKVTSAMTDLSYYDFSGATPKVVYQGQNVEAIQSKNGVSYFSESTFRSAPYFALKIDGINWLN